MSIKISLKKNLIDKQVKNYVLFCDENYKIYGLSKLSALLQRKELNQLILSNKQKDKKFLLFNINPNQKIILIKIEKKINQTDVEKIGAEFFDYIKSNSLFETTIFEQNIYDHNGTNKYFLDDFLHGVQLKSYEFVKYKSKNKNDIFQITVSFRKKLQNFNKDKRYNSLIEGTNYTKDLVSEPGNVLHPDEYAKRLKQLKKFGLKITVYDKKKLKKMGMNALLGVGQGSIRGSYLVVLEWNGLKSKKNH